MRDLIGRTSDVYAVTAGLSARRVTVRSSGPQTLDVAPESFTAIYVIEGETQINGATVVVNDEPTLTRATAVELDAKPGVEVFVISLRANPIYLPVRQGR